MGKLWVVVVHQKQTMWHFLDYARMGINATNRDVLLFLSAMFYKYSMSHVKVVQCHAVGLCVFLTTATASSRTWAGRQMRWTTMKSTLLFAKPVKRRMVSYFPNSTPIKNVPNAFIDTLWRTRLPNTIVDPNIYCSKSMSTLAFWVWIWTDLVWQRRPTGEHCHTTTSGADIYLDSSMSDWEACDCNYFVDCAETTQE